MSILSVFPFASSFDAIPATIAALSVQNFGSEMISFILSPARFWNLLLRSELHATPPQSRTDFAENASAAANVFVAVIPVTPKATGVGVGVATANADCAATKKPLTTKTAVVNNIKLF